MVDKISEEVALKKEKKSSKRKSSDTTEVVKKKKKKDKVKDVDGDEKVIDTNKDKVKEDTVEEEVPVKKKKPYFRDKGEKGVDEEAIKSKSKFSISLPVGDSGPAADLPVLKSSGKGPKIIIAQDSKKVETKKSEGPTKLSKRKRKHLNAGGTLPEEDSVHESKGMGKALKYLKTWDEDRESWKFEKCRQIWLLHNAYEESKVSEGIFPSLLRYMESIKGGMRQGAMDIARQKVEKGTKWEELSENKTDEEVRAELGEKLSECELKRAQQILEIFA